MEKQVAPIGSSAGSSVDQVDGVAGSSGSVGQQGKIRVPTDSQNAGTPNHSS